jgi:DNA repair protein RadC
LSKQLGLLKSGRQMASAVGAEATAREWRTKLLKAGFDALLHHELLKILLLIALLPRVTTPIAKIARTILQLRRRHHRAGERFCAQSMASTRLALRS